MPRFLTMIILISKGLLSSRLSVKEALILRSFGEAHQRSVHVCTHVHTREHTESIPSRRQHYSCWSDNLQSHSPLITFVIRPSLTTHHDAGPYCAVWILSAAQRSTSHRQEDPRLTRFASSSSQFEVKCQGAPKKVTPGAAAPTVT